MTTTQPIILWDIDGTLVRGKGGRVSVNAFMRALKRVASHLPAELEYPKDAGGMTDTGIALQALAMAKIAEAEAIQLLTRFAPAYRRELEGDRAKLLEDLEVLPGVPQILRELQQRNVTQTLLTGNLKPIAELKLSLVELDQFFDFEVGAFGSDHADRDKLVPLVRQRVRERLKFEPSDMVVVGDTPRDIACARAGGARVVAVASGYHSREQLEPLEPEVLLDNLADTKAVLETLLRYSTNSEEPRALIV